MVDDDRLAVYARWANALPYERLVEELSYSAVRLETYMAEVETLRARHEVLQNARARLLNVRDLGEGLEVG